MRHGFLGSCRLGSPEKLEATSSRKTGCQVARPQGFGLACDTCGSRSVQVSTDHYPSACFMVSNNDSLLGSIRIVLAVAIAIIITICCQARELKWIIIGALQNYKTKEYPATQGQNA